MLIVAHPCGLEACAIAHRERFAECAIPAKVQAVVAALAHIPIDGIGCGYFVHDG
jgi:hypothetical protein